MSTRVSWAVLLCKVSDDDSEPFTVDQMRRRFTVAGRGTPNAIDYWHEASYGQVDSTGSEVFGWLTLKRKQTEYQGSGGNPQGRQDLVTWAWDAAKAAHIDPTKYDGTIVITNVQLDEWGSWRTLVLGPDVADLTNACHEMGHGFGFDHSRDKSKPSEHYQDPWDIMSANNVFDTHLPETGRCGPFLNAALSRAAGWLPRERIWTFAEGNTAPYTQTAVLRPLHRADLSGYLAAEFDGYIVEFRTKNRWDSGIPRSCVLVHTFEGGTSYIVPSSNGVRDLQAGDSIGFAKAGLLSATGIGGQWGIRVKSIDETSEKAVVEFVSRPGKKLLAGPAISITGADAGGGGIVIVNGRIIRIPPRSPALQIAELAALIQEGHDLGDERLGLGIRRAALKSLRNEVRRQIQVEGQESSELR